MDQKLDLFLQLAILQTAFDRNWEVISAFLHCSMLIFAALLNKKTELRTSRRMWKSKRSDNHLSAIFLHWTKSVCLTVVFVNVKKLDRSVYFVAMHSNPENICFQQIVLTATKMVTVPKGKSKVTFVQGWRRFLQIYKSWRWKELFALDRSRTVPF